MSYWRGKVALVTGGSAGLGFALAEALARSGATVVIAARDTSRLEAAVSRLRQFGSTIEGISADIRSGEQTEQLFDRLASFGRLDALFNNAGVSDRGLLIETPLERLRELWDLNFLSAMRCARLAAPELLSRRGHLVFVGSLASKTAAKYIGGYPTSKFPLAAAAQQLRLEMGPQGLHVLLVCPGPLKRDDAGSRYDERASQLPSSARQPGGGVKLKGIDPNWLAGKILAACERRRPELVVPAKARLLFAITQLAPRLGDWILSKKQ